MQCAYLTICLELVFYKMQNVITIFSLLVPIYLDNKVIVSNIVYFSSESPTNAKE